jgi:hypothetical protein
MGHGSFEDGNSDEARKFILDRRCERNHPKRHRTLNRSRRRSAKKKRKLALTEARKKKEFKLYVQKVREYWNGERDTHP